MSRIYSPLLLLLPLFGFSDAILANPCENLTAAVAANNHIYDVSIDEATEHKGDAPWSTPAGGPRAATVHEAFCRVVGRIEDEIGFEIWLPPKAEWNGRLLGVGNGGEAGWINYGELYRGLARGFASASTDTGHKSADTHWALGHPRRVENFGHRAHHLLAVNAKKILALYYGKQQDFAYFIGCSGGGLQGLNEAQRYPADYNGIISGAAGYSMVPLSARFLLSGLLEQQQSAGNLSREQWQAVADQAVAHCDAQDGIEDGIIADPRRCDFEPTMVSELTEAQVERVRILYGPLHDTPSDDSNGSSSGKGELLYPGFYPGIQFIPQARQMGAAARSFGEWLYQDAEWKPEDFQLARDVKLASAHLPGLRAKNPDLEPFRRLGGKLISYIGWDDPIVPAQANIDYFQSVQTHFGPEKTAEFHRLFMAPGVGHCRGGAGPDLFGQAFAGDAPIVDEKHDLLSAIMAWVEQGVVPDKIIASRVRDGNVDMTRPLCPYPQQAHYLGRGDTNHAENFECR